MKFRIIIKLMYSCCYRCTFCTAYQFMKSFQHFFDASAGRLKEKLVLLLRNILNALWQFWLQLVSHAVLRCAVHDWVIALLFRLLVRVVFLRLSVWRSLWWECLLFAVLGIIHIYNVNTYTCSWIFGCNMFELLTNTTYVKHTFINVNKGLLNRLK